MFKTKNLIHLIVLLGLGLNVSCLFSDEEIQSFIDCADRRVGNNDGVLTNDHFLFVIATSNGNLGGLSGADDLCQAAADAGGLERCYKAVLADDTNTPATRLINNGGAVKNFTSSLVESDGEIIPFTFQTVTADLDDFHTFMAGLSVAPDRTIAGGSAADPVTWTGLITNGTSGTDNCTNWTSSSGGVVANVGTNTAIALMGDGPDSATVSTGLWIWNGGTSACDQPRSLYCVSQ